MRAFVLALMLLAVPALAMAQQADVQEEPIEARVQLEQTMPATATAADAADAETARAEVAEVRSNRAVTEAAVQDGGPTTMRWWWLVGAIVVGGILVAALVG